MVTKTESGGFSFIGAADKASARVGEEMVKRLHEGIRLWQASLLRTLTGQRSGREYYVPGTAVKYNASMPGEAPAVRLGILRASYATEVNAEALEAYLGSALDYSIFLERGTVHMEPRPALEPSFMAELPQIRAAMGEPFRASSDVNYKED